MSELQKARLQAINADGSTRGDAIPVQFNPASLRLQITNQVEGGATRGRQVRQYTGSSSTTLTVDLVFDTADEGTTDAPVSVREKTVAVEQFLHPQVEGTQKQAPPRLRFEWGDLVLEGVVESLNIDLDHFAPSGVPLRARVGFSFKEQDRRYEALAAGPGANETGGAPAPGEATPGAVGSQGSGANNRLATAIGGESAAELAARLGLDAAAWRGLSFEGSLGGALSLDAGLEVRFSAGLNVSAGVGVFVGAAAGASVSLEGAFGLKAEIGVTAVAGAGANAELQQNFSLTAAGGVTSALESIKTARADAAVAETRAAFAGSLSDAATSASAGSGMATSQAAGGVERGNAAAQRPALPAQERTPLRLTSGAPPAAGSSQLPSAPTPPAADPRAVSYGQGVPLRPTVRSQGAMSANSAQGTMAIVSGAGSAGVPTTFDPAVPPWEALPEGGAGLRTSRVGKHAKGPPRCGC